MTFDAKQLKAAAETVRLPEDMGERLLAACRADRGAKRGSFPRRKAIAGLIAACAVVLVCVGLWKVAGSRLWSTPIGVASETGGESSPQEDTSATYGGMGDPGTEGATGGDAAGGEEPPPVTISMYSREEIEEMREMALSADDEALQAYLRRLGLLYEVDREDLLAFVETLETLPYLPILEGEPVCIAYLPDFPILSVTLKGEDGDRVELNYEFYFNNPERLMTFLRDLAAEAPSLIEPFTCCDGRVTVYVESRIRDRDGQDFILWHATVDGILLQVFYYTDEPERIRAEELFDGLEIGTVCAYGK